MILGFAMELNNIAEDASAKTLRFADDMNNAIPCAAKGIPVAVCSPNLAATDFTPELERYMAALEEINKTTSPIRDSLMQELQDGKSLDEIGLKCVYDSKTQVLVCSP